MRQPISLFFAIVLAMSMMLACSRSERSGSSAGSEPLKERPSTATDAKAAPDGVKVLSAGRPPYFTPRWKFNPGQTQEAELSNQFKVRTTIGIQPMPETVSPPVTYEIRVEAREVDPDGTAHLRFEVLDAKVQSTAAASPELTQTLQQSAATLVGVTGTYSADALGRILDVDFEDSEAKRGANQTLLATLERLIDATLVPLPEEKIGVGATWTYANSFDEDGAKLRQVATFEMTELSEDKIKVRSKVDRHAEPQTISAPDGSQNYELLSLDSRGTGQTEALLDALVPNTGSMSVEAEMKMLVPGREGEKAQSVRTQMVTQTSVKAK